MKLAPRLEAVKPSATLSLNARAKSMMAQGADVVSFAAGEPDFETPDFVKNAAIEAIREGFTRYTATAGYLPLREAICQKLARENQLTFTPEQILVSNGAKQALYNFFQALLQEGDEVLIFSPYWVSYPDMVRLAGGTPVIVPTREEDGHAPSPQALQRALTPRTRAVILNSPSNPTGAMLSPEVLLGIAAAVREHDCLLVSDDIYEKLLYVPGPFRNIANVAPELRERTVVINGVSKAFAMTGWRLGYAAGPRPLIAAMQMVQEQSTSNASSVSQRAALAALQGPQEAIERMVVEYRARRDLIVAGLNAIPGVHCRSPEGAFYAFPNIQGLMGKRFNGRLIAGSMEASEILLDELQVAAVPGLPFGAEGFLRLSFATSRGNIEKGLARLKELGKAA